MKVCMLIYYYWPKKAGGAESQCRKLSHHLAENGLQVSIVTARFEPGAAHKDRDGITCIVRLPIFESWLKSFVRFGRNTKVNTGVGSAGLSHRNHGEAELNALRTFFGAVAAYLVRFLNVSIFFLALVAYLKKNSHNIDILHVHTADWLAGAAVIGG